MKINEKIRQLRMLKGYSQAEVAERLFISQRAYSNLENGKTKVDVERLEQIAKFYNLEVPDLFASDENIKPFQNLES